MVFIAYTFKGQVHVFAGLVKIVSHSFCRTSAILKYFCPPITVNILNFIHKLPAKKAYTNSTDPDQTAL